MLTELARPHFAAITMGWQPTRCAGQPRLPFADPEARCTACGAGRLQALQQIVGSLLDVFHAAGIGEGAQIQFGKHRAAT